MAKTADSLINNIPYVRDKLFDANNYFASNGDLAALEGSAVIIKRIFNQLMIKKGSYIFDPEIGEDILQFLFEPADLQTYNQLQHLVNEVVNQNKGNENVIGEVLFFQNKKGFRVNIIINTNGRIKKIPLDIDETYLKDMQ